jgi:D-3-phosphoglycerate dehydrogenase
MKSYQVIRTHSSAYQGKDFFELERKMVEDFLGLQYKSLEEALDVSTILITNTHTKLEKIPKNILNKTCLIIHPNSGYDHFCQSHEIWKNIPLVIGHEIRAQAVAEYSLGAVFENLLETPQHLNWNRERKWNRTLLNETNGWIFGYGHIGKIIADTLSTLGMKITVVDPFVKKCPHKLISHWEDDSIIDARLIISAMSLNHTSRKYFNHKFFQALSKNVLFINGARGELVEESSLKNYLLSNPNSFAYLDVFEKEPFGEEWHGFPQVWKTSHIAGVEKNLDIKILEFEKNVLEHFLFQSEDVFLKLFERKLIQNKWIQGVLI